MKSWGGFINKFNLNSILNASNESSIYPIYKSRWEYYSYFGNSFCILENGNDIIGINNKNKNCLISEEMALKHLTNVIGELKDEINTIIYSDLFNCLLVGDNNDNLVQFCLSTLRVIKNY